MSDDLIGRQFTIYNGIAYFSETVVNQKAAANAEASVKEKIATSQSSYENQAIGWIGGEVGYSNNKSYIPAQNMYLYHSSLTDSNNSPLQIIYTKNNLSFKNPNDGTKLYINDSEVLYSFIISSSGTYKVKEVDLAGNICEYIIIKSTSTPLFDSNNTEINDRSEIQTDKVITIWLNSSLNTYQILIVTTPENETKWIFTGGEYQLSTSGIYKLQIVDICLNKTVEKTVYYSNVSTSISITPNLDSELEEIGFTFVINKNNNLNKINSIQITFIPEGSDLQEVLSIDDLGVNINEKSYSYYFNKSGIYDITIWDNFGRHIYSSYELSRSKPKGTLYNSSNQVLATQIVKTDAEGNFINLNPVKTNRSVYLDWLDIAGDRFTATIVYKNGEKISEPYSKRVLISEAGIYVIRLTNNDSQYTDFCFEIDKTLPIGKFSQYDNMNGEQALNAEITNKTFAFSWEEDECTAIYYTKNSNNRIPYTSGTKITIADNHSTDNTYYFILTDAAGNYSTYTMVLDTTPVNVSIYANNKLVPNNSYTNGRVKFVWIESKATATLNGEEYISGTSVSADKVYVLKITDVVGNEASYRITINSEPISINILDEYNSPIEFGDYYNQSIRIMCSNKDKASITITLNGFVYEPGTLISIENKYELIIIDKYGNTLNHTFEIDKTAPKGTLSTTQLDGFQEGNITNGNVSLTWSEPYIKVTLNGNTYSKGDLIKTEGKHQFIMTDRSNNQTIINFEIDKTPIAIEVSGVIIGGVTNNEVTISYADETGASQYVNGYLDDTKSFIYENKYTITIYDIALNATTITFEIDKTAPEGVLSTTQSEGFQEGNITNGNVSFSWSEYGLTCLLNDQPYTKGSLIRTEGQHTIKLTDQAGNTTTYVFTIDKTYANYELIGVEEGGTTNGKVKIVWNQEEEYTAFLNGQKYISGNLIEKEGVYTFEIYSKNLQKTTFTFEIDLTAPTGSLSTTQVEGFQAEYLTNGDVKFTWTESGASCTLDGQSYSKNTTIKKEGTHTIILSDAVGNKTTYTFTINKQPVSYNLIGVENNSACNQNVFLEMISNFKQLSIQFNSEELEVRTDDFYEFTLEGTYTIILTSLAGTISQITFEIDLTAPTGNLSTTQVEGFQDGYLTNGDVKFDWEESGLTCYLDDERYFSNTTIKKEGAHMIVLYDKVGNKTTYTFTIDKSKPTYTINGSLNAANKTNSFISITWDEQAGYVATLNDQPYLNGTVISAENIYVFKITSKALNSTTFSFEIDKTAPTGILKTSENKELLNNSITAESVYLTWTESGVTCTLNGKPYSKGSLVKTPGEHHFLLSDSLGNVTEYIITIDIDNPVYEVFGTVNGGYTANVVYAIWNLEANYTVTLNDQKYEMGEFIKDDGFYVLEFITQSGISSIFVFTIDSKTPEGELIGVDEGGITNSSVYFTWEDETLTCTINDQPYTRETIITAEGIYSITLTSRSGLKNYYHFEIDLTPPTFTIHGLEAGAYLTSQSIWIEVLEGDVTLTLNGLPYEATTVIYTEGKYHLEVIDYVGNKATYDFEIDKTAPEGILSTSQAEGFQDGYLTNGEVKFTWTEAEVTCTLDGSKYIAGTPISKAGQHTIKLTDQAGNTTTYVFTIDKTVETLKFIDENGNILSDESYFLTAKNVILSYNNKVCIITINGEIYTDGSVISEAGTYDIIIIYTPTKTQNLYTLCIDKTAPIGILDGVENGGVTSTNVTFTWTESGCSCTLNGESYSKGSTIKTNGIYELVLTNKLGVQTVYTFEINKIYPEVTFKNMNDEIITLDLDQYINFDVKVEFDSKYILTINDTISQTTTLTAEGEYVLVLRNPVNQLETTYVFTIDKTAPIFEAKIGDTNIESGIKTNQSVVIKWNSDEAKLYYKKSEDDEFSRSFNGTLTISTNGIWTIICEDQAGNQTSITFERYKTSIDKTSISTVLYKLDDAGNEIKEEKGTIVNSYTSALSMTIDSKYSANLTFENLNGEITNVIYDGQKLTENGKYTITLSDEYGNTLSYSFRINIPVDNSSVNYLIHNIALLLIITIPTLGVIAICILKVRGKNKNMFKAKKH